MKQSSTYFIAVLSACIIFLVSILFFRTSSVHESGFPIQKILPSVVMIIDNGVVVGAGTLIDTQKGLILTSQHLVSGHSSFSIRTQENILYSVIHVFTGSGDIALLQIVPDKMIRSIVAPHIITSQNDIQRGEMVVAFGALTQSNSIILSQGIISDPHQKISLIAGQESNYLIQSDIRGQEGFSGGPLIDRRGYIIGVNTAMLGTQTNIFWSTPITQNDLYRLGR